MLDYGAFADDPSSEALQSSKIKAANAAPAFVGAPSAMQRLHSTPAPDLQLPDEELKLDSREKSAQSYEDLETEKPMASMRINYSYVPTRKSEKTSLSEHRRVHAVVSDGLLKDNGFFFANYVTFKVDTSPLDYSVRRKEADFYSLRTYLLKRFPNMFIPPLVPYKKKTEKKSLRRKQRYFTRFLNSVLYNPELRACMFL